MSEHDLIPGIGEPQKEENANDVDLLIQDLFNFHDSKRVQAAQRLGEIGNQAAIEPLKRRAIMDRCAEVRLTAFQSLERLDQKTAINTALSIGPDNEEDFKIRRYACNLIGASGNYNRLYERLSDPSIEVCNCAVYWIGEIKPKNIDKLINGVKEGKCAEIYTDALVAIGPTVIPTLLEMLCETENPAFAHAFSQLGQPAILAAKESLEKSLSIKYDNSGRNHRLQKNLIQILISLKNPEALRVLCEILEKDISIELKIQIITSLSDQYTIDKSLVEQVIFKAILSRSARSVSSPELRKMALQISIHLQFSNLFEILDAASKDGSSEISVQAIKTMSIFSDPRSQNWLCQQALNTYSSDQIFTIRLLGELRQASVIPTLIQIVLGNYGSQVRTEAIKALQKVSSPESFDALISVLGIDRDPAVRRAAIFALMPLKDPRALEYLSIVAQKDPAEEVRAAADVAIKYLGVQRDEEHAGGV